MRESDNQIQKSTATTGAALGKSFEGRSREQIEELLDGLEGANLSATIKTLNGLIRGGYSIKISQSVEYNEVQTRLYENTISKPIATGFIDRGHTQQAKYEAAEELRGLVRAYLCR